MRPDSLWAGLAPPGISLSFSTWSSAGIGANRHLKEGMGFGAGGPALK